MLRLAPGRRRGSAQPAALQNGFKADHGRLRRRIEHGDPGHHLDGLVKTDAIQFPPQRVIPAQQGGRGRADHQSHGEAEADAEGAFAKEESFEALGDGGLHGCLPGLAATLGVSGGCRAGGRHPHRG